ncbi:MAG: hypothetical protein J6334_13365, partial [Kiritimatiellae bacterium]|nr:hypothetical protein [Kiritimatiellia bacterium]
MNKMTRVLMVSAALCGTAWSVSQAYQLTHRWSFDSDYVDAITGAEATRNGGNVSLVDGAAVLSGNGYRDGSLNLGTGILGGGDATLEIWATQNQIRNWSRIFDYIKDRANYVMVSWTQGEDLSNDLFELRWQDQKPFSSGRITSPHILGTCYYVVVTFKLNADGSTSFRLMIRDTTTGSVTDRTETVGNWNLSMLADASFYLGQSAFDGDRDAAASYHEVRVWRGILPDEQLAANAIMGPNALPLPSGDDEVTTGFSIGEGQAFTVNNAGGYAEFEGIVTLAAGAKIRFDTAAFKGTEMRFKAGGYSFTGSSILDCVELTDSENYTAALGEDGKTITVTLNPTVPVTAVWSATTAPASGEDLANPANWTCRNASGAVLEGAVPGAKTVIVIPEGTTVFTLPLGYVPHWGGVQFGLDAHPAIRGGRIAYGDRGGMGDYSWRAIGSNTYTLLDPGADPLAVIASDSLGKSQLRFDGWFYVSAEQAGTWRFRQQIDDYCALAIDGDWILHVNSWNYQIFATRGLLEGWHRFSLICGDTYGGWGPSIHLDGYDINIPIAVRLPGAEGEIPFLAGGMTLGNESGTITLGTDCDWADLGPLTIRNGVTLDLNGHNLLVTDITGDHLGAAIVNSAETASTLTFIVDPETSESVENLIIASNINKAMDVPGVATALWTGNGNDGGVASNPANWECYSSRGALLPDAVPTEATTITLQGANVNLQVPPEATLNGRLFKIGDATLTADCDWRGLTLVPNVIGTLDLSGNNLQLINLTSGGTEGAKVVNSSTTDESELRFPIDSGITGQMESKLFGNNIKVIKEGYGVLADSVLRLGDGGTVSFTQNEGNVAIGDGGDSLIGAGNGGHGIYQLNSGNLTVNNNLMIGAHSAGDFVQTGGEVVVPNNWLAIGRWGDGTGTYTLSGGTVTAVNNGINVGEDGVGKLYVCGSGVLSSRNELHVAEFGNSKGDVWVEDNGAIIAQGNFQVGCRRSGTVTQSGGTVTCDGWFAIGRYFEGIGLYTLTGGTYTSRYNPGIIAEEGEGTFDISGSGVAELPHGTSIGHQATGRGTLKVHDGGMLVTPFIRQGPGRASLAFDGGTLVASGSGATLVDYFRGLTDVAVGPGGLTFNVGDNYVYALGTPFGSRKIEGPIVKTGTGSLTLDTLPPAGTFSIREGSLVLADNTPPTLAHRWSFNGDFQDSVGGKTASSIGGSLAFNAEGSAIVLSGNGGNSTGSLHLGPGVVPADVA